MSVLLPNEGRDADTMTPTTQQDNGEDPPNLKKRSRNLTYCKNSCQSCRTLHAKCSGEEPTCNGCAMRGIECVYVKTSRKRMKPNNSDSPRHSATPLATTVDSATIPPGVLAHLPAGALAMPLAPALAVNATLPPILNMTAPSVAPTPLFQQIQRHMTGMQLQAVFWREVCCLRLNTALLSNSHSQGFHTTKTPH